MALVKCSECGREISDKAVACPNCGMALAASSIMAKSGKKRNSFVLLGALLLGIVILVAFFGSPVSSQQQGLGPLPVFVQYRPALLGSGLVLILKNTSNRTLSILATFRNPTLNQQRSFRVDLDPAETKQIGHLEGWNFTSGDMIALSNHDYQAWTGTVP